MIAIESKTTKEELAENHWKWLKKLIKYDAVQKLSIDECNAVLQDSEKEDDEKKECALKVALGDALYSKLEDIIKGSFAKLKQIKKENPNYFLDNTTIISQKARVDEIADSIRFFKKRKLSADEKKLYKEIQNEYEEEDKKYVELKKELAAQLKKQTSVKYINKQKKEAFFDLITLLRYNSLHGKNKTWNAHILCNSLGVSVCPYCNRQYIYVAEKKEGGWVSSAQLDHFFPKDANPLFSCSFFNLIPSCYSCNHGKSDDIRETIYPYDQEFGENGKFIIKIPDGKLFDDLNLDYDNNHKNDIEIDIEVKSCDEKNLINSSISVFHLKEMYNMHQLDLKDFLKRFNCCKECRRYDYKNINLKVGRWDNLKKRDLILGFPLDAGDNEYPLKKMKYDILGQLEEIEGIKL